MVSDVEMNNPSSLVRRDKEDVQHAEGPRGDGEEIHGDDILCMIVQECSPGLRWRFSMANHVF